MIRQRFLRCGVIAVIVLASCIALPFLAYQYYRWQYCWFPLFGPNIEIVASACRVPIWTSISPNGRYIVYGAWENQLWGKRGAWMRDSMTGREESLAKTGAGQFWLSENLMLIAKQDGDNLSQSILDIDDKRMSPLRWVHAISGATTRTTDGKLVFSNQVVEWFREAERVYYIPERHIALALAHDFKLHPEGNFFLETPRTHRGGDEEAILAFLQENNISYIEIQNEPSYTSHDGGFQADFIGADILRFVDAQGRELARTTIPHTGLTTFYGWASDDSGVYVQGYQIGSIFLFEPAGPSRPVLKINLPKEYLSPEARQREETRQAEQLRIWVLVGAVVLLLGGALFGTWWWQKRVRR